MFAVMAVQAQLVTRLFGEGVGFRMSPCVFCMPGSIAFETLSDSMLDPKVWPKCGAHVHMNIHGLFARVNGWLGRDPLAP